MYLAKDMSFGKLATLILCLLLTVVTASAQSPVPSRRSGDRYVVGSAGGGTGAVMSNKGMLGGSISAEPALPSNYGKFKDEGLDDLSKAMEERDWGSEDTAWARAKSQDTIGGYQKYLARFPYGPHVGEAQNRIIDIRVNDALNSDHNELPQIQRTISDDDSPTSTIVVENTTRYPLTVMYSGLESRSITIPAHSRGTVTLKNGRYRIAASVPVASIIPYAGSQDFVGGRYETGYCIVRR